MHLRLKIVSRVVDRKCLFDWAFVNTIVTRQMAPNRIHPDFGKVQRTSNDLLYTTLNSGHRFPLIGYGSFPGETDKSEIKPAVFAALQAGYRHIDTAALYGTEDSVGEALQEAFKLWNNMHRKDQVEPALRESLRKLQLDYVDLYLVHWPAVEGQEEGSEVNPPLKETWQAMEAIHDKGLAKNIGLSNWSQTKTEELLSYARILPVVNQCEVHPYWRSTDLLNYMRSKGIHLSAYSPLGSQVPKCKDLVREVPEVQEVAKEVGKQPGQVLLRWGVQHGVSVLPKSANPDRIKANFDLSDWELSQQQMEKLNSIKYQSRAGSDPETRTAFWWSLMSEHGPYRKPEDLWDGP